MKKLNLKTLKLDADEMLQKEQLKTIMGGYDGGYGTPACPGYTPGTWSFTGGEGYRGCACVSESDAIHGTSHTKTEPYEDSRCSA